MSKINFIGLGGLGEYGKNLYVCEVDNRIFILDAGLKYPSVDLYGIDTIFPDIEYLKNNKDRIQGIFISHGHENGIGAIVELLKNFDVGVFGTHFTISLIEDAIHDAGLNIKNYRLYRINEDRKLKFGNVSVEFYSVSHSIPEAIHIAICTNDGVVVYAPDFCLNPSLDKKYNPSFSRINEIAKKGVLCVAAESVGTSNIDRAINNVTFDRIITDALQMGKRIIFSVFSDNLQRMQRLINICCQNNRRIAIIGLKTQRTVNVAMSNGYLNIPSDKLVTLKYLDEVNRNNDKDLVIIVAGMRHEPFYMIQRMCKKVDRLIEISEDDLVYLITPPVSGTEKIANKTKELLLRVGAKVKQINKSQLKSYHAGSEDLKMLYSMLNPKYILPINGEYRHQYMHKNMLIDSGFSKDRIIMLNNGDVCTFEDGSFTGIKDTVKCGDVLVDGSIVGDINEVVLKDREFLAQDGLFVASLSFDSTLKQIYTGPEIITKGFATGEAYDELIEELKDHIAENVYSFMYKKFIDWNEAKNRLRESIAKIINKRMKKSPIVMLTLINVSKKYIGK